MEKNCFSFIDDGAVKVFVKSLESEKRKRLSM